MNETLTMILLSFFFTYSIVITLMYFRMSKQIKRMAPQDKQR